VEIDDLPTEIATELRNRLARTNARLVKLYTTPGRGGNGPYARAKVERAYEGGGEVRDEQLWYDPTAARWRRS
jgi:hypothetical protein